MPVLLTPAAPGYIDTIPILSPPAPSPEEGRYYVCAALGKVVGPIRGWDGRMSVDVTRVERRRVCVGESCTTGREVTSVVKVVVNYQETIGINDIAVREPLPAPALLRAVGVDDDWEYTGEFRPLEPKDDGWLPLGWWEPNFLDRHGFCRVLCMPCDDACAMRWVNRPILRRVPRKVDFEDRWGNL